MDFDQNPLVKLAAFLGQHPTLGIACGVAWIVLCASLIAWSLMRRGKQGAGKAEFSGGMFIGDVDKMLQAGLITQDEYRAIKRKIATKALEQSRRQEASEAKDRAILEMAAADPSMLRQLLPPEALARAGRPVESPTLDAPPAPPDPAHAPALPPSPPSPQLAPSLPSPRVASATARVAQVSPITQASPPAQAAAPDVDDSMAGDPLGGVAPPGPSPAPAKGELDILLEKGAITAEQYRQLKGLAKQ
jgi:hypothetical protein